MMGAAKLTWEAPAGPWMQKIYRSVDDTLHFHSIAVVPSRTFINGGLQPGHTYYYAVTSAIFQNNTIIESPKSDIASFVLAPPPPRPKGVISGTVTDDSTGLPVRHAHIRFFRLPSPNNMGPGATTDSLGQYLAVLDTGTYLVKAEAMSPTPNTPPYLPEWFDNASDPSTATPVAVAESSLFVANFGLGRVVPPTFAFVSGTVTDTLGNPLRGASVVFMRPIQEIVSSEALTGDPKLDDVVNIEDFGYTPNVGWRGRTDSLGRYHARVIVGRSYLAMATKFTYLPEYYNNKTGPADADVILVTGDITGIDFSLAQNAAVQNSISGLVRDSLGTPVPSRIVLFPLRDDPAPGPWHLRYGHTDSLGVYTMSFVPAGRYFVMAIPFHAYAPAFYKAGAYGVHHWQNADTVTVAGDITGIDVGVKRIHSNGFAQVRGRVLASDGLPLEGTNVFAFAGNAIVAYTMTDAAGNYALQAMPFGRTQLVVDREGYTGSTSTLDISSLSHGDVNFVLSSPAVLSVDDAVTPDRFALDQNYPNPFNPTTTIGFTMPAAGTVTLKVYNLIGQEVTTLLNGQISAGAHQAFWNGMDASGRSMASGLYFYRLQAHAGGLDFTQMRKMVLMK